ncbi:hypothetical protein B0H13DRAFT_2235520 [Mycena leptocephala]|nr:hypothetical protein B0H13DRAFT_2235520 [Mycena leptocephala]
MCALFVGSNTIPTVETIHKLSPVLVSKNRAATLIDFLLLCNPMYRSVAQYSQSNMDDLFSEEDNPRDIAVPKAVGLACLPGNSTVDAATSGYAWRGERKDDDEDGTIVMEAVGYTAGERTPEAYSTMKATALAWCLDRKKFIQMQSGSSFISERDSNMLTFTLPHLDPWGIGGFYEPLRTPQQYISFERQVKNLLLQHDSVFQEDPNFAYICWNIIQKKEAQITTDVKEIAPALMDLLHKWEANPHAKPSNKQEKKAMRVLNKLKLVAKDLRGSSGYKQCRRNEIRAMIRKLGTPALFITLNPADIVDPLLGALGVIDFDTWPKRMACLVTVPATMVWSRLKVVEHSTVIC